MALAKLIDLKQKLPKGLIEKFTGIGSGPQNTKSPFQNKFAFLEKKSHFAAVARTTVLMITAASAA